jgi:hypothetical protein
VNRTWIVCLLTAIPCAARAFSYAEGTNGDLSGDRLSPTALVASPGANTLSGSTVFGDLDYVRITLPSGLQLASLILDSVTSVDDVAFIGMQSGTTFTVTPAEASAGDLLGYKHFGTGPTAGGATPGNDMLDDMCASAGAIGCTPPLLGSDFTFWIQQTSVSSFAYSLTFVAAVPEPGTFALVGLGLLGLATRRRSRAC